MPPTSRMASRFSLLRFLLVPALLSLSSIGLAEAQQQAQRILVFSKTAGFRHQSIEAGIAAIKKLGQENGLAVDATEDAAAFTDANLKKYRAVVFLSTTGDVLNDTQQDALERYVQAGGGWVGIHSATDTEYDWPWYGQLVGAYFKRHPAVQEAKVDVRDRTHLATKCLPAWGWSWYAASTSGPTPKRSLPTGPPAPKPTLPVRFGTARWTATTTATSVRRNSSARCRHFKSSTPMATRWWIAKRQKRRAGSNYRCLPPCRVPLLACPAVFCCGTLAA